jgi:hypothetical protein
MPDIKNGENQFFPHDLPLGLKKGHDGAIQKLNQARHSAMKIKKSTTEIKKELCAHYY